MMHWKAPRWTLVVTALVFCFFLFASNSLYRRNREPVLSFVDSELFRSPRKNIWLDLDQEEFEDVISYLYSTPNELNLTKFGDAGSWDNHVAIVEALMPNKSDALPYMISGADSPQRWARVVVSHGASEKAGINQYMVGPLPTSPETQIIPLTFCYNSNRNGVRNPLPNYNEIVEWFTDVGMELADLVDDLLGEIFDPARPPQEPQLMAISRPAAFNNGTVSSWASIHGFGLRLDAWSLLPQGLYCRFEITGRNSSQWSIGEWFYNGILYSSTEEFYSAWKKGLVAKIPANIDGSWTAAEPEIDGLSTRDHVPPPYMVQPQGGRFKIDKKERYVSWMGFEFYLNTMQATGLGVWDIRFHGERIMYELSLQEAMAHYAGEDPLAPGMVWLDTLFGMGVNMFELVQGYDCPAYAAYLPSSFYQGESKIERNNTICIFEYTADHAIQRHTTNTHVTVSRNNYLVVRSVSTVGNYDYTIDRIFFLDGTIEVKVRASGYIFGAYHQLEWMREDLSQHSDVSSYEYGYQVHDTVVTSMHDHTINFKADLDIGGVENTLYRVDVSPTSRQYSWEKTNYDTMHLTHTAVETERGVNWPSNSGAIYVVLNNESRNSWGERRGYRVTPGTGMGTPPHLTVQNSSALAKAGAWAYHDLWLLRQKDSEPKSSNEYNAMEPLDPLVDFEKMVDGEEVLQEDLVIYFNLGTHHVPHSGDIPNTLMHTSSSSVMFIPHNFFDRDPSRMSAQGVKLLMKEPCKGSEIQYFGAKNSQSFSIKPSDIEPDLSSYSAPQEIMDLSWNATLAAI